MIVHESKYTTKLRNIDKSDIFTFDFTMYGIDAEAQELHKQKFIDKFYDYYAFDEINGDSIAEFNLRLKKVIAEYLDKFNVLFQKQTETLGKDMYARVKTLDTTGTIDDEFDTIKNERTSKFLDTPSTPLGTSLDDYATNINKDVNDVNTKNTKTLDTTIEHKEEMDLPMKIFNEWYDKLYKDLDIELVKKFKKCFMLIY